MTQSSRTINIARNENNKYIIQFWENQTIAWSIESYTLLSNLQEIIFEWVEKGIVPPYRYT